MGLQRGKVKLISHNPRWHLDFEKEAVLLRGIFPDSRVEHVGSTAIPGISAKPIIDIAICVNDLAFANSIIDALNEISYEERHTNPVPGRRFFVKGPEKFRTHYLHVVDKEEFTRLLKFRDLLRKNKILAKKYDELKRRLAIKHSNDRANYTNLKNDFIKNVLES